MAKRRKEELAKPSKEWMNTFADLMNLLLCFFVLLFSMSTVDAQKFELIAASFVAPARKVRIRLRPSIEIICRLFLCFKFFLLPLHPMMSHSTAGGSLSGVH